MLRVALLVVCVLLVATPALADERTFARSYLAHQLELVKSGDLDRIKSTVVVREHERITTPNIERARKRSFDLDQLVGSAARDRLGNVVITTVAGKKLTTLVEADGLWRTDSAWFLD
jgi:hypothetical protein